MPMKIPPSELLIQVSNNPSAEAYQDVAPVIWAIEQPLHTAGYRLADFDRILDFGCGVGRLLQALNLSRRDGQTLSGCDVNEACATWCRENLDFASIARTAIEPPLPYAEDSFDLIVAISVFTHLSRRLQIAWARELMRVLRPGGVMLVTTWGLGILPDVLAINDHWKVREHVLLGATGNFLHFAEGDASALEGQREVVALHAHAAIAQVFAPLRYALHADISPVAAGQDASVLVKPPQGCRVILPADPPTAETGMVAIPADGRESDVTRYCFEAGAVGPARFRSYIAFLERRFDLIHMAVECRIKDRSSGRLLAQARLGFPSPVTLGVDHYIPFSIDFLSTDLVDVELALVLRRKPWQPAPIRFRWWDARVEIGRDLPRSDDAEAVRRTPPELVQLEEH